MKTTKPELAVPHEARRAFSGAYESPAEGLDDLIAIRAVATPLVVAELRAQAALIRRSAKYGPSDAWMTHKLDRRADELEAGA